MATHTMASALTPGIRDRLRALEYATSLPTWATSLLAICFGAAIIRSWRKGAIASRLHSETAEEAQDPGLFKKHSVYESFTTPSGITYPKIRVFYHAHSQGAKLPKDLPILVFMHGLGGNATQFSPLLTSMINVSPCLAIDLPGCGLSEFSPRDLSAYNISAFAELLYTAIDRYRDKENNQQVVLIGHSMGASICAALASSSSPLASLLSGAIIGFVALSPRSTIPSTRESHSVSRLRWVPSLLFDAMRLYDRRGGLFSRSITRVVGEGSDVETRRMQKKFNSQSKSAVFLRMLVGTMATPTAENGNSSVGWPGQRIWSGVKIPLLLVAGESDGLTPPDEVEQINRWLVNSAQTSKKSEHNPARGATSSAGDAQLASYQLSREGGGGSAPETPAEERVTEHDRTSKHAFAIKTVIFPAPAAHGLMYATSTVRILSGLIENFLSHHVDERLSLGWQLQHLTTSGKWDVKNLKKWQAIDPISKPIGGIFRAMKTMREVDDSHCPKEFVKHYSSSVLADGVAMIVDISHESPVYDPKGLEAGGVEYHKFPTVSKLPPTQDEVDHFISLVDQLRRSPKMQPSGDGERKPTIGVHCHYGFNRTGYFLICYLVEREGYKLYDAINEFAEKRTPGIKHEHFLNELYVRYAVRMERRNTIIA